MNCMGEQKVKKKIKSKVKYISSSVIKTYLLILLGALAILYPLIPNILNYPPNSINTAFDIEMSGISYLAQFISIYIIASVIGYVLLKILLKPIDIYLKNGLKEKKDLEKVTKQCVDYPYIIYVFQIILPIFIAFLLLIITGSHTLIMLYKIFIIVLSFGVFLAVVTFIFTKRYFAKILLKIFYEKPIKGIKLNLKTKIFLQIVPLFLMTILFTSLVGYTRIIKEKSELLYEIYDERLNISFYNNNNINNISEIEKSLNRIKLNKESDTVFIISEGQERTNNNKISHFFIAYTERFSDKNNGRTYDVYGVDAQGATRLVNINGIKYFAGIRFEVASNDALIFFAIIFVLMVFMMLFVLYHFAKTYSDEIIMIAQNLQNIVDIKDDYLYKKIPVTSNDEIGELVLAFNKIQDKEKKHVEYVKNNERIIMEQERLASLGQMIGGIAHNLRTPIMSIAGIVEALIELANEYDESIYNKNVSDEDHKEIASEMQSWIMKIKPHCAYMSDIISAVKDQAVSIGGNKNSTFTIAELINRIDILMKHELKKYHCELVKDIQIYLNTIIIGEINSLIQVINNLIINAIHSYDGKSGRIEISIIKKDDKIDFIIRDFGKGVPEKIKNKLFNEMVTTKGKDGTGLGLYISNSIIKGRFGGDMSFVSKEGEGATFTISIGLNKRIDTSMN